MKVSVQLNYYYLLISLIAILVVDVVRGHNNHGGGGHGGHHHRHLEGSAVSSKCSQREPTPDDLAARDRALELFQQNQAAGVAAASTTTITIPVCVFVITYTGNLGDIPDWQVQKQLDNLNKAFSSASCCDTGNPLLCPVKDCSVDIALNFTFAAFDNNTGQLIDGQTAPGVYDATACYICNTRSGTNATVNDRWAAGYDLDTMKATLRKGKANLLNLFFTDLADGSLSDSQYPWDYATNPTTDGVVVDRNTVAGQTNAYYKAYEEGDTTVHAVGHWLGLLDTFYGGCDVSDGIEDTPPEAHPYTSCDYPYTRDTCPGGGVDPIHNFMDFSFDVCRYEFTAGQALVMQACYNAYRLELGISPRSTITLQLNTATGTDPPLDLLVGETQTYQLALTGLKGPVTCTTSTLEGEVDLYVKLGSVPKLDGSDCCTSKTAGTAAESCALVKQPTGRTLRRCLRKKSCSRTLACKVAASKTLYATVTAVTSVHGLNIVCKDS